MWREKSTRGIFSSVIEREAEIVRRVVDMKQKKDGPTLCLVSSSGGHWEQLQKLKPLLDKYNGFLITEKTQFEADAKYLMLQTDLKDRRMVLRMIVNSIRALKIWVREKPDFVVTTGTMVAYPFYLLAVLTHKKFVFIETFGRADMPTGEALQEGRLWRLPVLSLEESIDICDSGIQGLSV